MRTPSPLPEDLLHRPFGVAEAARLGVGEGRLRGGDLARPFHGVRVHTGTGTGTSAATATAATSTEARCRAKAVTMRDGHVFSHVTACLLFGVIVPARLRSDDVDVAVFVPKAIPRGRGVCGHRLAAGGTRTTAIRGLPVVAAADAWCQLAGSASVRELVIAGDSLVRRKQPTCTMEELGEAVERHAGRRGHRRLVRALELVRPSTDSPEETSLRLDVMAYGLPEPQVNVPILDERGVQVALGDLAYRRYRVLLEYDGEHHRTDDRQFGRDIDRLDDLVHLGWRVFRFTRQHRGDARRSRLERVREALIERGWRPGDPA
ncbi:hypothetical protein ACDF64_06660 [Agromyces sp. MMS24-JH15]|uniref:hypothetical protein n=1 Tax=Agromyces sp. MMS24-JH15 TaxID=3243765 RepID=UPI003749105B